MVPSVFTKYYTGLLRRYLDMGPCSSLHPGGIVFIGVVHYRLVAVLINFLDQNALGEADRFAQPNSQLSEPFPEVDE
ncbi:hypothetical protein [Burkholderia ambifaria]|uniref:hypothetical protein n=1 Tax=Burkholderia ambifaria TaxID=152480 RepID=UPI00158C2C4C|nr:hypothetical protein [Burkholderia ambifaria]